jgi:WD40 repeat protein
MKFHWLPLAFVGLLGTVLGDWCAAAPAPPHLAELAPFEFECREFDRLHGLVFSPDGKTLYSTHYSNSILVWDLASRQHTGTLKPTPAMAPGQRGPILSPDGKMMACFCGTKIVLWDVLRYKQVGVLEEDGLVYWLAFSPDSKTLIAWLHGIKRGTSDPLRIWDVEKRKRVRTCKTPSGAIIQVTPDWGIRNPVLSIIRRPGESDTTFGFALADALSGQSVNCEWDQADAPRAYNFALNRAETIVASAGSDSPVQLWDRNSGKRLARSKPLPHSCRGLAFSPDGKILVACYGADAPTYSGGFVLYDVRTATVLTEVKKQGGIRGWAFSPDGRLLAVEDYNRIMLWSIPEEWRKKDK